MSVTLREDNASDEITAPAGMNCRSVSVSADEKGAAVGRRLEDGLGDTMHVLWSIIGAIVIGLVLGVLARIILPGDQKIPLWLTIVVGIIAAYIGTWIAVGLFGVSNDTSGFDWIEHLTQLVVAIIGIALVAGIWGRRKVRS